MPFDLTRYAESTARVDIGGIDFDAFRTRPLSDDVLRCLQYMHDVESHTVCYLRNLLNTRAHNDAEITTFLTVWNYEEHWHGEALARVLAAHGELEPAQRVESMRRRAGWRGAASPVAWMAFSALNRHFLAVHMTFGVINEWSTQAGYARLRSIARHPVLDELLARIMRQEGRHIDFYRQRAAQELDGHPGAQRMTRWALRHLWSPVGAKVMPRPETEHVVRTLFRGQEGAEMTARIDRRIAQLPGLAGINLMASSLPRLAA